MFTRINEGPDKDSLLHGGAATTASTDIAAAHNGKVLLKQNTPLVSILQKKFSRKKAKKKVLTYLTVHYQS